ncbi:MAG: three-Cys-motif partner protein TcmP [Gammaproteobacteria bacterium]|nr:three-Cys-motif partner protein TcmP [Gammaproteobacteria bacterium]
MSKTLWERGEQTEGKHLILRHYLDGWLPILGSWNGRLLIIDGFAGPGEYVGGEIGSPLIVLDRVRRHKGSGRLDGVEVVCLFIESDVRRANHLEALLKKQGRVAATWEVLTGSFEDNVTQILDHIDEQNEKLAPAFVIVDPFGVKGSRMEVIERVLRNDRSECMISFMYEHIRRFHAESSYEPHLDELFGTTRWRKCVEMAESDEKKVFLHDLFAKQLKRHGAKYVVPFELWRGGRHVYTIYFASGSLKGCDLMKSAIWKVDPTGNFAFRGYVAGQSVLFDADTEPLAKQLQAEFGERWTPIERLDDFVMGDGTMYHKGHLRQKTLQRLERQRRISVKRPRGGRGFPVGRGVEVFFL